MRVHVLYEADGICNISFEVKDTGIGISDEAGSTMFKPFVKNVESNQKQTDGLGLYVTQRLIHQMRGSMKYSSILGIGSVFKIRIPSDKIPNCVSRRLMEGKQGPVTSNKCNSSIGLHRKAAQFESSITTTPC